MSKDFGSTAPACWHCHWWGYLIGENGHGYCVNPALTPITAIPAHGCVFWRREPGTDEGQWTPAGLEHEHVAAVAAREDRAHLVAISEAAQRVRLPQGVYSIVLDRTGLVSAEGKWASAADIERGTAALRGINAAVRRGTL